MLESKGIGREEGYYVPREGCGRWGGAYSKCTKERAEGWTGVDVGAGIGQMGLNVFCLSSPLPLYPSW